MNIWGQVNMKNLTKKQFKDIVLKDGHVKIDDNLYYIVTRVHEDNFKNFPQKLKEQLVEENKYGNWIGMFGDSVDEKLEAMQLPLYGDPNRVVTKWFVSSPEKAIDNDLKDRGMGLLKRYNEYLRSQLG